jgi:hypothetical protein
MTRQIAENVEEFLIFGSPRIEEHSIEEVANVLRSGWLGSGPKCKAFEAAFENYLQAGAALAVNSCTAALHLALLALDIGPGDEVITTPMTFCATSNVIVHSGATPVFADIDPITWNLDPVQVARKITARTKAILPVHYLGRPCDVKAFDGLARKHDLKVIYGKLGGRYLLQFPHYEEHNDGRGRHARVAAGGPHPQSRCAPPEWAGCRFLDSLPGKALRSLPNRHRRF